MSNCGIVEFNLKTIKNEQQDCKPKIDPFLFKIRVYKNLVDPKGHLNPLGNENEDSSNVY